MYKIVFTHFGIHDGLGEWHTIVLEEKKKTIQTVCLCGFIANSLKRIDSEVKRLATE